MGNLGTGMIISQSAAKSLKNLLSVSLGLHINEINNHDTAKIA